MVCAIQFSAGNRPEKPKRCRLPELFQLQSGANLPKLTGK
jgi:hypothetical protein